MTDGNDPSFAKVQDLAAWAIVGAALIYIVGVFIPVPAFGESGIASTYGYNNGRGDSATQGVACGGILNTMALTAAHKTLRYGTKVKVTNRRNGRSVVVAINDRGPFIKGRIIDLSPAAARAIGMGYSIAPVNIEVVGCVPRLSGASLVGC